MTIDISGSAIPLFQSEERLELLNDIDRFRQHGLENLPQIVVCGDTSSGKSSVLEALSGIPFPVDSTICTRFATAVALRYAAHEGVIGEASITPSEAATESHRARVLSFSRQIQTLDGIPDILQQAKELMGVAGDCGISRDVLHLTLRGRSLPNLTLVDLPGLIHASRNVQDIAKVRQLVEDHFKQENSIILTVVSAENPIDSQGILTFSRKFDPDGARSMGVITKPDLLSRPDKARMLPSILELAENRTQAFRFKRPWHIVRCLNDDERQNGKDRDSLEHDLLAGHPWDQFPRSQRGVPALRLRLGEYLQEHIDQVLPELAESLQKKVSSIKSSLEKLGPPRTTSVDRMQYLIRISRRYGQLVQEALDGTYASPIFNGDNNPNRLRATTMRLADDFEGEMRMKGHATEISKTTLFFQFKPGSGSTSFPEQVSLAEALERVGKRIQSHRGPELPLLFNPRLVGELFKEQSAKWPTLVTAYTDRVCQAVRDVLLSIVRGISPSHKTAEALSRHILDVALGECEKELESKVRELCAPFTRGTFLFSTKTRLEASLKMVEDQDKIQMKLDVESKALNPTKTTAVATDASPPPSAHDNRLKLLQLSRAYYNVALGTFLDNVVVLGVESCLLSKLGDIFSPETVARMDDDTLQLLGGESPDTAADREDLQAQLTKLEASLKTCRRHVGRFRLAKPASGVKSPPPATTTTGAKPLVNGTKDVPPPPTSSAFSFSLATPERDPSSREAAFIGHTW